MRTPAGKECRYFYGDYYRGRNYQECRLIDPGNARGQWRPDLCSRCPVPEILMANACPHMILEPRLERSFPLLKRQVRIKTYCTQTDREGFDPHIGCGQCHPLPPAFTGDSS